MKLTPEQIQRVASAVASSTDDVKHVRVVEPTAGFDRIDYQLHYRNGTFGSHVVIRRDGSFVEPLTPSEFVDGLIAGDTTNIDPTR